MLTSLPTALLTTALALLLFAAGPADAGGQARSARSPEISADRRVTFRLRAPGAKAVTVSRDGGAPLTMVRDDTGLWSATTEPLDPDSYGYSFVVDGVRLIDPQNPLMKPNMFGAESMVEVRGEPGPAWQEANVPHGTIHHHYYHSDVVGDNRDFFVYTPPGYNPRASKAYPTLYLLHGFSDDASAWWSVGNANFILDNLIAAGTAKPMVVVMPLGYGAPEILLRGAPRDPGVWQRNITKFGQALLTEVLPAVEAGYRVSKDRQNRAVAGLSMGGAESLMVGLNNLDKFSRVGAFSSGGINEEYATAFPALDASANRQLALLWIACGTEDGLLGANRKFKAWLDTKDVKYTSIETPGSHSWLVWRRNLTAFAPLLFRDPTAVRF